MIKVDVDNEHRKEHNSIYRILYNGHTFKVGPKMCVLPTMFLQRILISH